MMNTYIGIDLGTSSSKYVLVTAAGEVLSSVSEEYPVYYPKSGWSEQNPEDWYNALLRGIPKLLKGLDPKSVKGIGFGGQMHGLVVLDGNDEVIRPCILWNDGRTQKQTDHLNEVIGKENLSRYTANIAFAGFTAPKLLWLKENEEENFNKISKIMLPKDYLAYKLTGEFVTDYSDASGMLLLDVENKTWSEEMMNICSVKREQLPSLRESYEKIGVLSEELKKLWSLGDVTVAIGAGDNAAAAIGVGAVKDGDTNISLGTSGTVFICEDKFTALQKNELHAFCHADGKYHLMGCILSAASCNSWWMDILNAKDFASEQKGLEEFLGKNDVFFLPYLMGERSPHNDVSARGAFIGMRADTVREQMTLAVFEGVAFALRDCVEVAKANGVNVNKTKICGGGSKSELWKKIIANVLNIPVTVPVLQEGPSLGGAILSMVASGEYENVETAVSAVVKDKEVIYPDKEFSSLYEERYDIFKRIYPALKGVTALY